MRLISFLSDFGTADTYVGQVKGAIATVAPDAVVVDLTHQVPAQDVRAGAFLLWTAVEAFPPGAVHLAVVDPGVGTSRRAVAVRSARGDVFVGPDNGLLPMAVARLGGARLAVELTNTEFHRMARSDTFHGRDLFGPVAAYLAKGTDVELLGAEAGALASPYQLPAPRRELDHWVGQIVHVDAYGNLLTSFTAEHLPPRYEVVVGDKRIRGGAAANYQAVDTGDLVAVIGGSGLMELAVRDGSAALMLGLERDAKVVVRAFAP